MSDVSKEARDLAFKLASTKEFQEWAIAAALQKLMDERDGISRALQIRVDSAVDEGRATAAARERAEKAEAERDAIMCASNNHAARVQETECKLAKLVREVRKWWRQSEPPIGCDLEDILKKYEAKS